jgi:hypothetical protein
VIHVGFSELRLAFRRHEGKALGNSESELLLLFYAVECGMKAEYLTSNRLTSTAQITHRGVQGTHNLAEIAKALRVPASVSGACPGFKLRRGGGSYDISYAHEAWRYGVAMVPADQTAIVGWLRAMVQWIKRRGI